VSADPYADRPVAMPQGRRSTELVMLVFALAVVLLAYVAANLGLSDKLPSGPLLYIIVYAILMLVAHVAVRRFAPFADPLLLPLAALLNGLGIVMIYRLQESGRNGNPGNPVAGLLASATKTQLLWTGVGIVLLVLVLAVITETRVLQRYTYTLGALGLVLLAIPALLPASHSTVNGAKVWIIFGGLSVEPGEFARLALAVFFAGYLVSKRDVLALAGRRVAGIDLPRARDLGPVLAAWVATLLVLIFETDIGTAALFFGMFIAMLYIATQRVSWLLIGVLLFLFGTFITANLFHHVMERFTVWLHPFQGSNPTGIAYQPVQALEGLAYGGLFGTGLGHGQPYYTPLVQSDFIFSAFGEELGLVGVMALLIVFGLLVQRGLRAAIAVNDPFAKLLVGGLSFVLALQVFVIVGGISGLIPLTGVTTPFLSQGGSSLVASWILIGLLVRVSDTARKPAPQPIQDEGVTQVVRAA
jgi:cell division protein FtsW (lipid II flippase)